MSDNPSSRYFTDIKKELEKIDKEIDRLRAEDLILAAFLESIKRQRQTLARYKIDYKDTTGV